MGAQQLRLDIISNNLANVNTTGFKKSRGDFEDLIYQTTRQAGGELPGGGQVPTSLQVGWGRPVAIARSFPRVTTSTPKTNWTWPSKARAFTRSW
jgi:flagellar basal-body rod protein FlgG